MLTLLLNARDAVLEIGASAPRIVVTLAEASAADVASRPELAASQRWVVMTVSDEGPGMTEEVVGRAFEPFFSTKDVGKGTGLGLATAYATIREHGGLIECHSRLGEGTRFVVHLPVAETPSRPASRSTAPPEPGEGIRVLVVDDERAIRVVVQHMLEEAGFAVRVASSAEEAVATLGRDAEVDVVLLDRSMPGAPGSRLLPELRRLCPTAKVLYFTGQQVARGEAEAVDGVVHKPIEAAALVAALRRVVVPRRTAPPRFDANGFTASDEER